MSLRGGSASSCPMQEQLPPEVVVTDGEVLSIDRTDVFTLNLANGSAATARAVFLATPAYVTTK